MSDSLAVFVRDQRDNAEADIDRLLQSGAEIDAPDATSTALGHAAERGDLALVALLLRRGASVDKGRVDGQSPLTVAARCGHAEVVRALLAAGAARDHPGDGGLTPLMQAVFRGHVAVVEELLRAGADLTTTMATYLMTPLHIAVARSPLCVRPLLIFGADIHAKALHGHVPLLFASPGQSDDAARWLLAAGAPVDCVDINGCTPLHLAVNGNRVSTVRLLLDAGVDWRHANKNGQTALVRAGQLGCEPVRQLLAAAEQLTEAEWAAVRAALQASLETERRALKRGRLDVIRARATDICLGLETLELPAFVTLTIIEEACEWAHLPTMHQIWSLVTAVKHFQR